MAAKHKHRHAPQLTAAEIEARVRRALAEGRSQHALELAKQLHKQEPTPAHRQLLQSAYLERGRALLRQGQPRDAAAVLDNAVALGGGDPAWLTDLADALAAAGDVRRALELGRRLPDEALQARVLARGADAAVERGPAGRGLLPPELHGAFDAVVNAFALTADGKDDAAREALQAIGLRSPFLEWKLLLRGLLAYYQGDDTRALENWQRLDSGRLPARLAAPLRLPIDPEFRAAQPPETRAALQKQLDRLQGAGVGPALRAVQKALADPDQFPSAFRLAEPVVPALRQLDPALATRLASCFYWAIVEHGNPDDLPHYRRVFGAPPEDPDLHRLRALLFEHMGDLAAAHADWQRFDEWLAGNPPAWGETAAAGATERARALIWLHMGRNADRVPDVDKIPGLPAFLRDHPDRPRPLKPTAEQCYRRSLELAPDALEAHQALLHHELEHDRPRKAEQAARRLLKQFPTHAPTLETLGDLLQQRPDAAGALAAWQQALQADPLNRRLRGKVGMGHLGVAREHAEAGRFDQARAEYQAALELDDSDRASVLCKWAACEFRAGATDRAEELLRQARDAGASAAAVAYAALIETIRLKLSPALKARFEDELAAALAAPPVPADAATLATIASTHRLAGITYPGQKGHEKKVLAYVQRVRPNAFTAEQLRAVCHALVTVGGAVRAVRKLAAAGQRRFPDDPFFYYVEAETYFTRGPAQAPVWKVRPLLDRAAELAAKLPPDERQKALVAIIRERQEALAAVGPAGMGFLQEAFEQLFGGGFGDYDDGPEDDWDDGGWYIDDEDDEGPDDFIDPFPRRPRKKRRKRR